MSFPFFRGVDVVCPWPWPWSWLCSGPLGEECLRFFGRSPESLFFECDSSFSFWLPEDDSWAFRREYSLYFAAVWDTVSPGLRALNCVQNAQ